MLVLVIVAGGCTEADGVGLDPGSDEYTWLRDDVLVLVVVVCGCTEADGVGF